ncbi:MAG TPA: hypothetical protein VLA12_24060, partial [Planctomycetaceae bacterium]|nr:hypothetical protein [Planctomycetaceae bacterium]
MHKRTASLSWREFPIERISAGTGLTAFQTGIFAALISYETCELPLNQASSQEIAEANDETCESLPALARGLLLAISTLYPPGDKARSADQPQDHLPALSRALGNESRKNNGFVF